LLNKNKAGNSYYVPSHCFCRVGCFAVMLN